MGHAWMLGVLDDLRTYAELNGLDRLAESLATASVVAEDDAAPWGDAPGRAWPDRAGPGHRLGLDRGGAQPR